MCPSRRAGVWLWAKAVHGPSSPLLAWCPCCRGARGLGRSSPEPRLGSHVALILLFSGPAWDTLRFPSLPLWESLLPPLHLLRAMPERELWPAGPGSDAVTRVGSWDSMASTASTRSGSVCTPSRTPGPLSAHLPTTPLLAASLPSASSRSEAHRSVFLPLSHPWFYRIGWDNPRDQ